MTLVRSPQFLALDALLLSILESFEQYREHGVSYHRSFFLYLALAAILFCGAELF